MSNTKKEMHNLAANLVTTLTFAKDEYDKNGASLFFTFLFESAINISSAILSKTQPESETQPKEEI